MEAAERLEAGMVWVNNPLIDNDALPFGGWKASGLGRELGRQGLDAFRRSKMVIIDHKPVGPGLVVSLSRRMVSRSREDASMSDDAGRTSWMRLPTGSRKHDIAEVECLIPDMNGVLRGKVLPVEKFLKALDGAPLYMPTSALLVCADGRYSGSIDEGFAYGDPDMQMVPDLDTLCAAPGRQPRASLRDGGRVLSGGPACGARCRARC